MDWWPVASPSGAISRFFGPPFSDLVRCVRFALLCLVRGAEGGEFVRLKPRGLLQLAANECACKYHPCCIPEVPVPVPLDNGA